jgi:hypothetical protein
MNLKICEFIGGCLMILGIVSIWIGLICNDTILEIFGFLGAIFGGEFYIMADLRRLLSKKRKV